MKTKDRRCNQPPLTPPYARRGIAGSPPQMRRGWGWSEACADVVFERLRCAGGAVRSGCAARPNPSLRDIADPHIGVCTIREWHGWRRKPTVERCFLANKARMSMKTKDRRCNQPPLTPPYASRGIAGSPPQMRRGWGWWEACADVAFERLRCAEGAVRSNCADRHDLSLRDIADPTPRGLRHPGMAWLEVKADRGGKFLSEQSENVYENKDK